MTAGFEDGLNPCVLLTCSVFVMLCLWFERRHLDIKKCAMVFIVSSFVFNFIFGLGFLGRFLWAEDFTRYLIIANAVLAFFCAVAGVIFVYDWVLMLRGKDPQILWSGRLFRSHKTTQNNLLISAGIVVIAAVMSILASVWPPNYYITMIANNLGLPGMFLEAFALLALYAIVQLWLLIVIALVFSGNKLTSRLRQMISAAVFFSAAGIVFYIF